MSQPNPSAELEELIAETRAQAIRETAQRCIEVVDDFIDPKCECTQCVTLRQISATLNLLGKSF